MPRFSLSRPDIHLPLPKPLRALPPAVVWQILLLISVNIIVWVAIGIILHFYPVLISSAVLSYTLGLRHALDADHISAIDLMTRRLIAAGQRPVSVGSWFSLGHSTIVVITCVVVAATSGALRDRFDGFQRVGNIVGTSVSAAFLLVLCAGNAWVLSRLVKRLRTLLEGRRRQVRDGEDAPGDEDTAAAQLSLEGAGFLANVFRKLFRIVDRPWKMYPLGVMFGLGFDTSSEIAILGIASIQGAAGTSLWLILVFPVLFTGEYSHKSAQDTARQLLTLFSSWHVSPRHDGRGSDDGPVYLQGLLEGPHRDPVLLHCLDRDHDCGVGLHRGHPGSDAGVKRRRA